MAPTIAPPAAAIGRVTGLVAITAHAAGVAIEVIAGLALAPKKAAAFAATAVLAIWVFLSKPPKR